MAGCRYGEHMTTKVVSEIRASGGERLQVAEVNELIHDGSGSMKVLVGGEELELPPSLVRLLMVGAGALSDGASLAVVSEEAELSPAEAAKLLGVSRQYVDRLVANGLIPARQLPGSRYRKIPVRDVLAHRTAKDAKRAGIASILDAADQAGLSY